MILLYTLGIRLYALMLRLAAPFHPKAKLWVQGRHGWLTHHAEMARQLPPGKRVWFHCASLGEFEQARPLIEALHARPNRPAILVSFFSPSGYEIRKNYPKADAIFYLPGDTPAAARALLDIWQPDLLILVKYEIWLNLLAALRERQVPAMLISARLREGSKIFSGLLAREYRAAYTGLAAIFTQDADTATRLHALVPAARVIPGNDTRYDRVRETRAAWQPIPEIEAFVADRPCIVCGSTWPVEEKLLLGKATQSLLNQHDACMIVAPHEIGESHVAAIMQQAGEGAVRWSHYLKNSENQKIVSSIIVIDNIGMLSRLYAYGQVAYVGGAFGSGLHNILEAAVFGVPVLFGPRHGDFPEAQKLVTAGGGFPIAGEADLLALLGRFLADPATAQAAGQQATALVEALAGATQAILGEIDSQPWLR